MTKQKFETAGAILPGQPKAKPTKRERAFHALWQEWYRYSRIRLAAAVAGDVDTTRDAKVDKLYRGKHKTVADVIMSTVALHDINESLSEFHNVVVDHKLTEDAMKVLTRTSGEARTLTPKYTPRELAKKGFTATEVIDGVTVTWTPENYKTAPAKLIEKRLAEIAEYEKSVEELNQCKCSIHYDKKGNRLSPEEFQKKMRKLYARKRKTRGEDA